MRLLRPFFLIRIGVVPSNRIGPLSNELDAYLWEVRKGRAQAVRGDIWFPYGPICNPYLLKLWKQRIRILSAWFFSTVHRINRVIPGGSRHEIPRASVLSQVECYLPCGPPELTIPPHDLERGKRLLALLGVPADHRFVCILGRDPAYLITHLGVDYDHHAYRNVDISTYADTALALAELGYFVIRVGSNVQDAFNVNHERVIDYANSEYQDQFMDIFLSATCEFFVSVGSGLDSVARLFRRPVIATNYIPVSPFARHYDFVLPKAMFWKATGHELTVNEMVSQSSFYDKDYRERGINIVDNTNEQLREAVLDFEVRLSASQRSKAEHDERSTRFWDVFTDTYSSDWLTDVDTIRPPIAQSFLDRHPELDG